jgi:hypothetical protein
VAKLPPLASPTPGPALATPTPEVEVLPTQQLVRQGTKQRRVQVDAVEAQIMGEIKAIQTIEPMLGRGKRTKISKKW